MVAEKAEPFTFVRTKLFRPRVGDKVIARTRLLNRLAQGLNCKLTLVSAPAGFGKTTLTAAWLAGLHAEAIKDASQQVSPIDDCYLSSTVRTAWLSLDEGDNDPVRFFTHLMAALGQIDERLERPLVRIRNSPQLPSPELLIGQLVNEIAGIDGSAVLVLDDYHDIKNLYIHRSIAFLLEHQPSTIHLVLVTREDPPLPLARMRGRGELLDIRQGDLRFTVEETAAFLNDLMNLDLSPEEIQALERRTEGWVVGLQLAALSMHASNNIPQFIRSFTGSHRYIMEYLLEEVFQQQSEVVQNFLLNTSILDRLSRSLCDAVVGNDRNQLEEVDILDYLYGANLFVFPLDEAGEWYRYHNLFTDLLRHRLQLDGRSVAVLHRRASRWYEKNGFPEKAIAHGLAAQDYTRVSQLIETAGEPLLRLGQIATLMGWIRSLPAEEILARPRLCFIAAWTTSLTGQIEEAEKYLASIDQVTQDYPDLLGELMVLRAHIARAQHNVHETIHYSNKALALLPQEDYNARSVVGVNLGAGYVYGGDFNRAIEAWSGAARDGERSGNFHAGALSLSFIGQIRAAWGQLHQAANLHRQSTQLGRQEGALPVTARAYVNLARLHYEWNDLTRANQYLTEAHDLCRFSGDINAERDAYRVQARVLQALGDATGALEAARKAYALLQGDDAPVNAQLATAITHVLVALAQDNLNMAVRWIERMDEMAPDDSPVRLDMFANAGFLSSPGYARARVMLAQGQKQAAAELLADCYNAATANKLGYCLVTTRLLQAIAAASTAAAMDFFADALVKAQAEEYRRSFLDLGQPVMRLLKLALDQDITPAYTTMLLAGSSVRPLADQDSSLSSSSRAQSELIELLSEREVEILRYLSERHTNAEIALALVLSPNTVKTHLQHIYEKLGVHNRRDAVVRAQELSLLPPR